MPQQLLTVRESIDAALGKVASSDVETAWSGAGPLPQDPDWAGGQVFVDRREMIVEASPEVARVIGDERGGDGDDRTGAGRGQPTDHRSPLRSLRSLRSTKKAGYASIRKLK